MPDPLGRLCRAEDVLVVCAVAGGRLAVLGSAHTSPVGTLTPGGPGARPPLGGAAPPHGAAGLAKPRLKCLPPGNQPPLPPWPPPPGTRAACLRHWPATSATARAAYPRHARWSPRPVCAWLLPVCVCVCFPPRPVGFLRPGGFALAVVPLLSAAPLCAVLPLRSRLLASCSGLLDCCWPLLPSVAPLTSS